MTETREVKATAQLDRLRVLVEAGISLSSELSPDALLQRLVITSASYLPPDVETALYRIVQEALTNVVKHASAARVSITLVRKGRAALVVVEDDGRGFDVEATRPRALGFVGMRERVALVGGRLMVESTPGAGTTLVAEVPTEDGEDRS